MTVLALLELTKPSVTWLVVLTAAAGFWLGSPGAPDLLTLAHAVLGTALVAGGTNALNEWWEREVDARMYRTMGRPLPSGRVSPAGALAFALVVSGAGIAHLWLFVNHATALLATGTLAVYVLVYTPLKRHTPLATLVGAVPGALPIVGGWTAATGSMALPAWVLFGILFLWQLPHFYALAWMYRDDYRRGGLATLSVVDPDGRVTGRWTALGSAALVAASALPGALGLAGGLYLVGAVALGAWLFGRSAAFALRPTARRARGVFLASVVYLPIVLSLLVAGKAVG